MVIPGISPQSAASFRMIDVGDKKDTRRRALATGRFFADVNTIQQIVKKQIPKGDVLALAEIAGIQGAKSTANLLPLCHPLPLHSVRVWTEPFEDSILVSCEAVTTGKTGVEMEALTGVSMALLCIYDLTKMIDPVLRIGDIQLEIKEGGKSGVWKNPKRIEQSHAHSVEKKLKNVNVCLLTISDRCSKMESVDTSGQLMRSWFIDNGATIAEQLVVPDEIETIVSVLENWIEAGNLALIVTTGGTGVSPRDLTPEAYQLLVKKLKGKEIPGIGEMLRHNGAQFTQMAWLSRSIGVLIKNTTLIALPGNPKAVDEGLNILSPVFSHLLHIKSGGDHIGEHNIRGHK
ncbi:MAG: bifunctional molybdenum cofactor biosynthesis protein MoaC/MoaB [Oligoflexia bacterium]|nr:bifunctional molybdenum cofactor biosynthesis protein MoaC/MoaB [Oligoflexia bacterium]